MARTKKTPPTTEAAAFEQGLVEKGVPSPIAELLAPIFTDPGPILAIEVDPTDAALAKAFAEYLADTKPVVPVVPPLLPPPSGDADTRPLGEVLADVFDPSAYAKAPLSSHPTIQGTAYFKTIVPGLLDNNDRRRTGEFTFTPEFLTWFTNANLVRIPWADVSCVVERINNPPSRAQK